MPRFCSIIRTHNTAGQFLAAVHSTAIPVGFFGFPSKIQNGVYKEDLILSNPLYYRPGSPTVESIGLHYPGIAGRVNYYASVKRFSSLTKGRTAKPARSSTSEITLDYRNVRSLPHFSTTSDLRTQAFSATSTSPSRPSTITTSEALRSKKTAYAPYVERIRDNCTNLATLETSLRFRM